MASVSHIEYLQAETTWEKSLEGKKKRYLLAAILQVGLYYLDLWQPMTLREPKRMSETVGIKSRFGKLDEIQLSKLECKSSGIWGRASIQVFIWQFCEGDTLKKYLQIMSICFLSETYTTLSWKEYLCFFLEWQINERQITSSINFLACSGIHFLSFRTDSVL